VLSQLSVSVLYPDLWQMKSLSLVWQVLTAFACFLLPFGCASSFLHWRKIREGRNCVSTSSELKNCSQCSRTHWGGQFSTICRASCFHRRAVGGEQKWNYCIIAIKSHFLAEDGRYQMWQRLAGSQRHTRSVILSVWHFLCL